MLRKVVNQETGMTKEVVYIERRTGEIVEFDKTRIIMAIEKAMRNGSGIYIPNVATEISEEIEDLAYKLAQGQVTMTVYDIENLVYQGLISRDQSLTAKAYESFRAVQEFKREKNTTDRDVLDLLDYVNEEVMNENSNKNAKIASTQRDLIAGEVSKDIARRKIVPSHLIQAHDEGAIHIHK